MRTAKEIALISVYTALLIGGQFVFSGISGIEIVTALLLAFSYYFGIRRGLLAANAFSLLRCFIFGFFPTVIILYLVYYNLFVVVFGLLGIRFKKEISVKKLIVIVLCAILMTALFTGLDDLITPLFYGYSLNAMKAYAVASLTAVIPQIICTAVTVTLFLPVLIRIFGNTFFNDLSESQKPTFLSGKKGKTKDLPFFRKRKVGPKKSNK